LDGLQFWLFVIARQLWSRYFPKTAMPPDDDAGERETILKVVEAVNQDHGMPEEKRLNPILADLAEKHNVPIAWDRRGSLCKRYYKFGVGNKS